MMNKILHKPGIHGPKPVGPGPSGLVLGPGQGQQNFENIEPIRTGPRIPDIDYVRYMYCKNNLRVYSNRSGHKLNCRWPISMSDNFMTIKTATFVNS